MTSEDSVISHILSIRGRIKRMKELADINLLETQKQQKKWYDKNSRKGVFFPSDRVLLLLPSNSNKLLAKWQGPFKVLEQVGDLDYLIEMPNRRRRKGLFHINVFKKWKSPAEVCNLAENVEEENEFLDCKEESVCKVKIGEELSSDQKKKLYRTLEEFKDGLQGKPGRTNAAVHSINTEAKPFRLQPYRIPHAYKEEVAKELKEIERNNIIEPSSSEWASPIVNVRKKDGSIRLCVDFRKLIQLQLWILTLCQEWMTF